MSYKVVVVQTSLVGFNHCKRALESEGFHEGTYYLTMDPNLASLYLKLAIDERQLLVTGSFKEDQHFTDGFVRDAKARNERLVAVNFGSISVWGEMYNITIPQVSETNPRFDGFAELIKHIRGFLARLESDPEW